MKPPSCAPTTHEALSNSTKCTTWGVIGRKLGWEISISNFFGQKKLRKVTQLYEKGILFHNFLLLKKSPIAKKKNVFFSNNVTTFMSIGYTFKSFLEKSRPLKSKFAYGCFLPWLHSGIGKKKKKPLVSTWQTKQTNDLPQNIDIEGQSNIQRYCKESSKKKDK